MKVFSLQSKKALFIWSVILGLVLNFFISRYTFNIDVKVIKPLDKTADCLVGSKNYDGYRCSVEISETYSQGFPIKVSAVKPFEAKIFLYNIVYNSLIWILVVLLVLSSGKYFRKKPREVQ